MKTLDQIIWVDPRIIEKANELHQDWFSEFKKAGLKQSILTSYKKLIDFEKSIISQLPDLNQLVKSIFQYDSFDSLGYDFDFDRNSLLVTYKPSGVPVSFWHVDFADVVIRDEFAAENFKISLDDG